MIINESLNESSPASNLLRLLKRRGAMTIREIMKDMNVTINAVRVQLDKLMAGGFVEARSENQGRGRPHLVYTLTEKANKLFPTNYAELLNVLLEKALRSDDAGNKEESIEYLVEKLSARFHEQLKGAMPDEKLNEFAVLLRKRGIMVDVTEDKKGIVFNEFNCPYHEIVQLYPEICTIEQKTFSRLFSSAVQLNHCMVQGHSYCQFTIDIHNPPAAGENKMTYEM